LRHQGWIFALFPTGTRLRVDDDSTQQAIAEIHGYLRLFDYLLLGHVDGCTLPVSKDHDFTHETPNLDRIVYTLGDVQRCDDWLDAAAARFPQLDPRNAAVRAMSDDIASLAVRPS
jgi:hypothetical protein